MKNYFDLDNLSNLLDGSVISVSLFILRPVWKVCLLNQTSTITDKQKKDCYFKVPLVKCLICICFKEKIRKLLDNACNRVFAFLRPMCRRFLAKVKNKLMDILQQPNAPRTVCVKLHICKSRL